MLPYHCPECGVPIFKYQDKMMCPSCGKEAVFESDLEGGSEEKSGVSEDETQKRDKVKSIGESDVKLDELQSNQRSKSDLDDSVKTRLGKTTSVTGSSSASEIEASRRLKDVLEIKINDISDLLAKAKSPAEIEKLLNLLEKIFSLLKELESREGGQIKI